MRNGQLEDDPYLSSNKDKSILLEDEKDYPSQLDIKVLKLKELPFKQNLYNVSIKLALSWVMRPIFSSIKSALKRKMGSLGSVFIKEAVKYPTKDSYLHSNLGAICRNIEHRPHRN
ncbi:hypothetical protein COCNU_05G000680 [Cocos nucifera]|uniref:Uncharacterized protein n=1 Tax=Cocos nucifera TaxID=13894 RepID=A0A8K0I810_COCNU|nr:hypothetical protein COCNU_05G000680 [Cocos nucifera]